MPGIFRVAVSSLIERDGKILVLHRKILRDHGGGQWEAVSGRLEQGESPEQALVREVKEETGLEVNILEPFDTYHIYRGTAREELIGITYHCTYVSGNLRLSEEHDEAKWVPFEELSTLDVSDGINRCFQKFLKRINKRLVAK